MVKADGAIALSSIVLAIPQEELGRVTSLIYTLCYIGNPLGIAVAGPIGDAIGVDRLFV